MAEADTTTAPAPDEGGPAGWRPNPGDVIEGHIMDVSAGTSTQQTDRAGNALLYPLLTVRRAGTEEDVMVHCFHQTLQRAILDHRPEIGHRIRIQFKGKQQLKSNPTRSVAVYSVQLPDSPITAASVYDQIGKQGAGTPKPPADAPVAADEDFEF